MIEFRMKARDGSYRWILSRGRSLEFDADGKPTRLIGTHIDITERKRAEAELRESQVRLEQRVAERTADLKVANHALEKAARLKDEFMASVSHELRTPLTGVLGLAESLRSGTYGDLTEKQHNTLKTIESSGRHLLDLINDILDLSKIEAGNFEVTMETCSLSEVCQSSLQLVRGLAHQKKQDVRFSISPASIILNADPRRLKQMLVNLLGNAIKFTPDGGSLGIQVMGTQEDQQVAITVWDKGIGIHKDDLPRLFQPFVQLDSGLSRQYGGTGLGLVLVQRLAHLHGGDVKVESSPGLGSRFSILLPWENPPVTAATAAQPQQPARSKGSQTGQRVMIVDDNATILEVMCDFLGSRKYQTTGVETGEEMLARLSEIEPDILLVDIQMPGMDGLEVIRRVRAHPDLRIAALPVLAVTALAMDGDRDRCMEAGATEYISKPVRLEDLADAVRRCLPQAADVSKT
jgi:signal transduction histidine kinase/CheY-like chemotaxis protein